MSALAARRAAAVSAPLPGDAHDPPISPKLVRPVKPMSRKNPSPPRPPCSSVDLDGDEENDGSSIQAQVSSKRRRIDKSPPARPRYFAAEPVAPTAAESKGRARAFSPSGPVEVDGEEDSSDDEATNDRSMIGDASRDVDKGNMAWSGPTTRAAQATSGSSRSRQTEQATSSFVPQEGINFLSVSNTEPALAGMSEISCPGVLLRLARGESLILAGSYAFTVLCGSIDIASSTLSASSPPNHFVYAPTSHPIPVITWLPGPSSRSPLLKSFRLPPSFLTSDQSDPHTILLIREHRSGIEGLRGGAVPGFSLIWLQESGSWGLRDVHPVIGSFATPVYPYITPSSWSHALDALIPGDAEIDSSDLASPVVALVKGPKRSGKSTLARAAVNQLLEGYETVAWLECDLGQGEFGCGGVAGIWLLDRPILGPSFTHPRRPARAHYLGTYTPLTCPDEYIAAIRYLVEYYRFAIQYPSGPASGSSTKRHDVVPLVVNTQGWVKGLGEELLRSVEGIVDPTHVFAFEAPNLEEVIPDGIGWTSSPAHHDSGLPHVNGHGAPRPTASGTTFVIEPAPVSPLQARHTASDLRILSTIAYLYADLSTDSPTWDFTCPLLAIPPWEVDLGPSCALEKVYLIGEGSDGILSADLCLALNGALVALIEDQSTDHSELYVRGRSPSIESNFLGMALIRSLKPNATGFTLQLVTPLPPKHLARATGIAKNPAIELPLCGLLDWKDGYGPEGMGGKKWDEIPFVEVGPVGVGGERRRYRRNLMRKGM